MAPAIEARGISRSFGAVHALRDVSFAIPAGQLVAFLGPNGAGKSTTMRILTGALSPNEGRAFIGGVDVAVDRLSAARRLGYLPENGPLYPDMTPVDLLRFMARVRGLESARTRDRIEQVIEQCRLSAVVGRPIGTLSKGFRQRVGMAAALLHEPEVLILDEPTAGLDPNQVEHVRTLLRGLTKSQTVLLSTHILSEVRALADRILVLSRGRIVHDGPTGSLGATERDMETRFRDLTAQARPAA